MAEKQSCYHSFELEESRDYIDILYKTLSELPPMVPVMKCSDTQLTGRPIDSLCKHKIFCNLYSYPIMKLSYN